LAGERERKEEKVECTFVEDISQVSDLLQSCMGDFSLGMLGITKLFNNDAVKLLPDILVTSEIPECRAEERGRRITTGQKDIQHVVTENLRVIIVRREGFSKNVASAFNPILLSVPLCLDGAVDVVVDDFMDAARGFTELLGVDRPVKVQCHASPRQIFLSEIERLGKALRSAY
jgi:hypothetical protein